MKGIERFRKDIETGHLCIGTYISLKDPLVTDVLADSVDFFWIDLEHTAMSLETMSEHLLAARGKNIPAIVRVPDSNTNFIKRALDMGADGIIVPQIRSVEEVRKVVSDCLYPPLGKRGYGPTVPSNYGRNENMEFIKNANKNVFICVMLETLDALNSIDDILAVKGLNSLVIGVMDLSGELGVWGQLEHPRFNEALNIIINKTRSAGLAVGACVGAEYAQNAIDMVKLGVQWITVGCDFELLFRSFDQLKMRIKNSDYCE